MTATHMIKSHILIGTIDKEKKEKTEKINSAMADLYKTKSDSEKLFETKLPKSIQQKKDLLDEFIKSQDKYKGVVKKDYDSDTYRSAILAVRLVLNSDKTTDELKEQALDLYRLLRPKLEENGVKNLPLPYPPSVVSKTNEEKISDAIYNASQNKTKPETTDTILKNIEDLESRLLLVKKEIEMYIEGNKDRPGSYYISKGWGERLEGLISKYRDLSNTYDEYLDKANERKLKPVKNKNLLYDSVQKYEIYASNAKQVEHYLEEMKFSLRNTDILNYNTIVFQTMNKIKPLIKGPLERKFRITDDRSYLKTLAVEKNVNPDSNLAYLELTYALSKEKSFLKSNIIETMEGLNKQKINFGNIDSTSAYNAYKDISIFGKYELYKHFNGSIPTNGEEFGTLLLGMSIMGYDSSAQVLKSYGSNLYGRFDYNGSLLVMQHIGAATNYAENICDYSNLEGYITIDIANGYAKSRNVDEFRARKQAGIKGRENSQTVGRPGQGVEESFNEGTSSGKVTTYLSLISQNENQTGFYIEKPPVLFDPNLAFNVRIKKMREAMQTILSQKVDITISPPSPESKLALLPSDLNGFAYMRYRDTNLDSINFDLSERYNLEKTKEGETTKRIDDSTTSLNIGSTGETSAVSGKGTYSMRKVEENKKVTDRVDSGEYNVNVENIVGTRGFAKGKFDYSDYKETLEIENYLNSTNTFKNSNVLFYVNTKKSISLDTNTGKELDTGKSSVFEIQSFIKTEYGWVHAGTDQLDSNVNSVYGQALVNISEQSYVEGGSSGLVFYGNVKENVLDNLKQGISIESDFFGKKESEFEGAGGGLQLGKYGLGGTYQKSIIGEDRGLIVASFNGMDVQGWGGVYINPSQEQVKTNPESTIKTNYDTTKRVPLMKETQSKSDILKENLEGVGFREVTFSKLSGGTFMNDAFFQLKEDYKEFYGGLLGRFVLENGTFFGGAGIYDQKEDQGKGTAYLSNKERTKFITSQIIGSELNLDAVTSGFMYKKLFDWDVNLKGFANYKDKDNTSFGAEFDFLNERIVIYSIGGVTNQGSISDNDKHLFTVLGGKFTPFTDTGFSIEGYGLIGENALGLGPGGFANPQYVGETWATGVFGGGNVGGYGTLSLYGAIFNEDLSLVVLGTWAKLSEKGVIDISGSIETPGGAGYGPINVPIFVSLPVENNGNIFELGLVSQFYLTNSLDLNLSALWSGQFNENKSNANLALIEFGIEKRLSWPYSLEIYNDTAMQWIDNLNSKMMNAKSNLNFRFNVKQSFYLEASGGVEYRKLESKEKETDKTGLNFIIRGGVDF